MTLSSAEEGISVVLPAFNEEAAVGREIEAVHAVMRQTGRPYEIVVVDDGSTDETAARAAAHEIRLIRRDRNYGYGSALKAGIAEVKFDWILILDADGTYPSAAISLLLEHLPACDMVVGARTGKIVQSPWIRRGPKWLLRQYAGYLSGQRIPDLNSGMRIMPKAVVERFLDVLPSGFSFTTTITLAMIANGYKVLYQPIDYFKRVGTSKIRPVDFFRILTMITRLMLMFSPLRLLVTAGSLVLLLAFLAYRYNLTPVHFSAAGFMSVSIFTLTICGLVEYRSHQFRMAPVVVRSAPGKKLFRRIVSSRGLRVLGSIVLLASLTFILPKDKILAALRVIHPAILAAAIPLLLLAHVLGSWKWHLLVNKGGAGLRFSTSVRLYFSGLFGNLFLPSIVGGDAVMVALGLRETRSRGAIIVGSLVNRVLDLVALMAMSFVGAVGLGDALDAQSRRWLGTVLIVAAGGVIFLISAFLLHPDRLPPKLRAWYLKHQSLIDALRRPQTYPAPFAMSVLMQSILLVLTAWIAETSGLHIALSVWLLAWPLAKLVALLPVTVGGIGARELALAALLAPFGVPAPSAIVVGLAWDAVLVGGGLAAGLISRILALKAAPLRIG